MAGCFGGTSTAPCKATTMRNNRYILQAGFLLLAALAGPAAAADTADTHVNETAKTPAAVIAVDNHWMQAEINGDTQWLGHLLLPGYRSISPDGKATSRAAILAHAAKNRGSDKMKRKVAAWLKAHPTKSTVVMHGNVAILSFYDPKLGAQKGVRSSDIFVYEDGHWHALYSQHSQASG